MEKTNKEKLEEFIAKELNGKIEKLKSFNFGKVLKDGDADNSPIMKVIYELLWGNSLLITKDAYSGDTINTFATLLGKELEKELISLNNNEEISHLPNMTVGNLEIDENLKIEIAKFNNTFLSVGNFMPLPTKKPINFDKTINQYRGSTNGYRDYFDKFLCELKKCYLKKGYDEDLYKIFKANEKYFDSFGKGETGFLQYCNDYFLDAYIDSNTKEVITYFKVNRHWVEGKNLSKEEYTEDIKNYIGRATEIINLRADKIICRLEEILKES